MLHPSLLLFLNIFTVVFSKFNIKYNNNENVISPKTFAIWKNATVPFYVNPAHFDHEQTTAILTALSMFAFKTCIKFKPVMARPFPTDDVLVFINPDGTRRCQIDSKGHSVFNPHLVKLGYECLQSPQVDMMIMRALGFPFEHNRDNRDLYIDVLHENIEPGAMELFTKTDSLPLELRFLPYDVNSVLHFANREYSKNGHRTIIFKDTSVKQNRVGLTNTDLKKIEIVYGPECRARDRQEKIELCQSYPGVARKKRETEYNALGDHEQNPGPAERRKRNVDIDVDTLVTKSLRVNPDITPPPENRTDDVTKMLKDLGIDHEVQDIVDKVFEVSSLALKNARDKYCNDSSAKPPALQDIKDTKATRRNSDILGIIEVVADFTQGMVNDAVKNLTKFCQVSEAIEVYQRYKCGQGGSDPRCRNTYRSTKSGAVIHSTQHRPVMQHSTFHNGGASVRVQYARDGNATESEGSLPTTLSVRKKRELEPTTDKPGDKIEQNKTETVEFKANENKTEVKTDEKKIELSEMEKAAALEEEKNKSEKTKALKEGNNESDKKELPFQDKNHDSEKKEVIDNKLKQEDKKEVENDDIKAKPETKIKVNNKDDLRMGTKSPGLKKLRYNRRSHTHHRAKYDDTSDELDNLDSILAKKIIEKKRQLVSDDKRYPKNKDIEETRHKIREKTKKHRKQKRQKQISIPSVDNIRIIGENPNTRQKEGKPVKIIKKELRLPQRKKVKDYESVEDIPIRSDDELNTPEGKTALDEEAVDEEALEEAVEEIVNEQSVKEVEEAAEESSEESAEEKSPPSRHKKRRPNAGPTVETSLPRTIALSKKNEDFYNERRWPDGELIYMIQVDTTYDLSDMRHRLKEVADILKEKTCVRMKEIKTTDTDKYEDYIVIDNSPDYVTGRVGGEQRFGSIELFRGGQHRQHAAMMVMAMLGFYFEVSRHDRDKYIRVHMRHVRPDKLHHFEMIRSDATLALPYDYASATHPAWQFWRQMGRTGISTVATFKEKDPDGSIMKSLGQHDKLLSDLDIVKINSVYGIDCFMKDALRKTRPKQRKTLQKIVPMQKHLVNRKAVSSVKN